PSDLLQLGRGQRRGRAALTAVGGQRPGDRVAHRVALAVVLLEPVLLRLVASALLVGEVHGSPEVPGLVVPVGSPANGARRARGVLLPGQNRDVAPDRVADALALLLRPVVLLGQIERGVQVASPLVVRDLRQASTLDDAWDGE